MKVILTGYRACGKTTVGKLLALLLNVAFYDTDQVIAEAYGAPVGKIITLKGWDYFRGRETAAIKTLAIKNDCVIATGGGIILAQENVELLKNMGKVVWLNAPREDIIKRLERDATRPQFTDKSIEQETIAVLEERLPLYRKTADYTIDTDGKTAAQIAEEIYHRL